MRWSPSTVLPTPLHTIKLIPISVLNRVHTMLTLLTPMAQRPLLGVIMMPLPLTNWWDRSLLVSLSHTHTHTLSLSLSLSLTLSLSLSARLEQALRRWTHEKETSSLETEKYIKMRTTSASLVEQLDRASAEVDRLSDRLGQYDNLPLPVSTHVSMNILFVFYLNLY